MSVIKQYGYEYLTSRQLNENLHVANSTPRLFSLDVMKDVFSIGVVNMYGKCSIRKSFNVCSASIIQ